MQESRWPVIIFSRIIAFAQSFDVFSLPYFPSDTSRYLDRRDPTVSSLIITPSHTADISVNYVPGDGRSTLNGELSAYCAGTFMYAVRGLPTEDIEVETSEKIYRIKKDGKSKKTSVILPKCKVLYTNKVENVDEIDLYVSAYSYKDRIFKLTECKHSEHFSDANLRTLLRSAVGDSLDGVAAYSFQDGEALVRSVLADPSDVNDRLYILLAVATALSRRAFIPRLTVKYDGGEIKVTCMGDELAVSDEKIEIFTLNAPDIE